MSALDDFIAQDPISRDFVDLMGSIRFNEEQVRTRTEQILAAVYTVEAQRILARKADVYQLQRLQVLAPDPELNLPAYELSLAEKQELMDFGGMSILCGALKDVMWARAQRVNAALDYEDARNFLNSLPPPPEDASPDPWADVRSAFQAMLDAATQDTVDLVAQRDAWREAQQGQ